MATPFRPALALLLGLTLAVFARFAAAEDVAEEPTLFAIRSFPARSVDAELTVKITAPEFEAREWIVYAANLPQVPSQQKVRSTLSPGGELVREGSDMKRAVLRARVTPALGDPKDQLQLTVQYQAQLFGRELVTVLPGERQPAVKPLADNVRQAALQPGTQTDFESPAFQAWIDKHQLRRDADEPAFDFGKRVFQHIQRNYQYDYQLQMNRVASAVCSAENSDCGGLSFLFVSVMRANNIPARTLFGRWAKSATPDEKIGEVAYYQAHVKAEFFDDAMGWVPADLASGVLHDRTPNGLHFFGSDPGDFIVFHVDTDLKLDTIHFGQSEILSLQNIAFWVTGKGTLDGIKTQEDWKVREVKIVQ